MKNLLRSVFGFHRFWAAFAAVFVALCLAAGGLPVRALDAQAVGGFTGFSIEQVYVNVPELDVFVTAQDDTGSPIDPMLVQAAGVELYIGEEKIPTGNIGMASEPICYLVVIDNSTAILKDDLAAVRGAVRTLIKNKGERDQIALYTTAGGPACVLPATDDGAAAMRALSGIEQAAGELDVTSLVTSVYSDVNAAYQSLAPRKCLLLFTDIMQTAANPALLAGLAGDASEQLNMAMTAFAVGQPEEKEAVEPLAALTGGRLVTATRAELSRAVTGRQQALANVLEFKTEVDLSLYGERLDTLTVTVPSLGSAVRDETSVYMGHRLASPAVTGVTLTGRDTLTVTFNQAVSNADNARRFAISSDDIWGWRPSIRAVELSEDGMTATLTLEPLYRGRYDLSLRKVASRLTPANVSDADAVTSFTVEDWPPDSLFYLRRFRGPAAVLGAALLLLAVHGLWQRLRDREAEKTAEAEHLLESAAEAANTLPTRWLTLYVRTRRTVADTRWTGQVQGSLVVGTDPEQCDLCIEDHRAAPQHCILWVEDDRVLVQALGSAVVQVQGQRIGDAHVLHNNDVIKLARTTLRVVL